MVNLFSGGRHAGGQVAIQDLLVVSMADDTREQLHQVEQVYAAASRLIFDKYGMREVTADEGGMAPDFRTSEDLFVDAASAFFADGRYHIDGQQLTGDELSEVINGWCDRYPIVNIEDSLAEDEWHGWTKLRASLSAEVVLIGDDLLCTKVGRVEQAISNSPAEQAPTQPHTASPNATAQTTPHFSAPTQNRKQQTVHVHPLRRQHTQH